MTQPLTNEVTTQAASISAVPPAVEQYLNKANHNEKLAELLIEQGEDGFPDWLVVVRFYKGLHWISAWLTQQGCPAAGFASHGVTRATINYSPKTRPQYPYPVSKHAYNAYIDLYDMSITARYKGFLSEEGMKKMAKVDAANCIQSLNVLKNFIEGKGLSLG